jgi:hypothetical protein
MSIRSEKLREYGRDLQADVNSGTVFMGKFIIDCANDLERGESDLLGIREMLSRAKAAVDLADQIALTNLRREMP